MLRQPIVTVMGHVDHGKTTYLDYIRKSTVCKRETGGITQHVGASEVPLKEITNQCGNLLEKYKINLTIPGLLFIDTPGHEAFTNLRKRGGSIADIAVLVIDVTKGVEAQTIEAIEILKEYKTPFLIALNKVDALSGWKSNGLCFVDSIEKQFPQVQQDLDQRIYTLIGKLYEYGFQAERFDRVTDFAKQILIIPISAKTGDGIPETLVFISGLAQKFFQNKLELHENDKGKASILEVREEIGLGKTLDVILYDGVIKEGDEIVFATTEGTKSSHVKALFKPKPLDDMRDPTQKFTPVSKVTAAAGVKISCEHADKAIAGSSLLVVEGSNEDELKIISDEVNEIIQETQEDGVILKADTLGSLEAIMKIFTSAGIPVKITGIGNPSVTEVIKANSIKERNKFLGVIFAFNVSITEEVEKQAQELGVKIFNEKIIYNLQEGYKQWKQEKIDEEKKQAFTSLNFPCKILVMPGLCFRASNPAIFGVEVLEGRLKQGMKFTKEDGTTVGSVKNIQDKKEAIPEAKKGMQIAVSMQEPFYGRQVKEKDVLYAVMYKNDFKAFETKYAQALNEDEKELMQKIRKINVQ
ncbi:MAG: translation initiation factor IF-2 [Candidatus Micrarchaeota archaeon]